MKVKIGISNRHVHLCGEDLHKLFGKNAILTKRNDLIQPEEFACNETVTLKTDKDLIEDVRIIGPIRPYTQVEVSKTDAYKLGINPPIRNSGDLRDASLITIVGPKGEVTKECAIIANRHLHINKEDRKKYGLNNLSEIKLKLINKKGGVIDHVKIKEGNYSFEVHLDTDDANSFLLTSNDMGELIIE
jgi:putative phosphotransacetylase